MKEYILSLIILLLCYNEAILKTSDVRNHLGSRTPYRFRGNKNDSKIKFPNCKDSKIWMIIRHGTRQPSSKDIINMNTTLKDLKYEILLQHKLGKGELSKDQLKSLELWSTNNITIEEDRFLTLEGQEEMILLAERMQNRFPGAIKQKYSNNSFLFRYTATQRAQQSARYFTNGLFEKKDLKDIIFSPAVKADPVLRFYKHCDKWQKQVKKNPNTYMEMQLFGVSDEMNKTLERVSKRLGLKHVMSLDNLNLIYKTCGYETSWNKYFHSPWCSVFDTYDVKVLEYYHDLRHYWLDGYGHELTYKQACVSIKHMFETFSNESKPNATFLFAHSGTVLKILTYLGLFKPKEHLRGNIFLQERAWRTSDIDCFGANIAFVLYRCKDEDKVLTLHQERIIKLPMCKTELCPLKLLKNELQESITKCNYTDMCSLV